MLPSQAHFAIPQLDASLKLTPSLDFLPYIIPRQKEIGLWPCMHWTLVQFPSDITWSVRLDLTSPFSAPLCKVTDRPVQEPDLSLILT